MSDLEPKSLGILRQSELRGELPIRMDCVGEGDHTLTLWRFPGDGTEVIETNGDPLWEADTGFYDLRERFAAD